MFEYIKNKSRYWLYLAKIRTFLSRYSWVVKDGLKDHTKKVVTIVLIMIVGAFVQGSTIAFLSFFINIIQSQKKTGFSYLDNIISNNVFSLFIMSTILFILLFLSAVSGEPPHAENELLLGSELESRPDRWVDHLGIEPPSGLDPPGGEG